MAGQCDSPDQDPQGSRFDAVLENRIYGNASCVCYHQYPVLSLWRAVLARRLEKFVTGYEVVKSSVEFGGLCVSTFTQYMIRF